MQKVADLSGYPLSPALTHRVVNYLNGFRLFISVALAFAYLSGWLVQGQTISNSTLAAAVLLVYFIFSVYFIFASRQDDERFYSLAFQSLLLDVILIFLLLNTFSGLAVLLVFVGAAAGIILPLRLALAITALAAIAIISQPIIESILGTPGTQNLLAAALYGLTLFVITTLTHILACWARDFRLIAERQMATLTRLEQINELIIRRLRSGVLAVDQEGQIKMMNESAWFLLGSPPASDRSLDDVSPELKRSLQEWLDDPRLEPETLNLNASQADVVPKFVSLPAGREISVVIFLEDNDVLSQRALELSSISLAKLSTSIAHEVRNPLAAISHAAQLLGEEKDLQAEQAKLVGIIVNHVKRMNGIIENILQMSRREKSQHELFNISEWLVELVSEFSNTHPGHPVELIIGENDENAIVLFDRSQLHQVIWKLLENAVQHIGKDNKEPGLALVLKVDETSGFCVISVVDDGPGIAEDKIGKIFEPFFTTRKQGSGLGLYIARQLCEANQAEMTVDSIPGERTRFHIRMALASGSGANVIDLEAFRENP